MNHGRKVEEALANPTFGAREVREVVYSLSEVE